MQRVNIRHVSNLHNDWLRALDFYKQEAKILTERLTEIAGKNTSKEVAAEAEHFENLFLLHGENMDLLAHNIHQNISAMADEMKNIKTGYIDVQSQKLHDTLQEKFSAEERAFNDVRHSFMLFAAQWM